LKIFDVSTGTGATVVAGNTVNVNYTGWLLNGTAFNENITTSFSLNSVIQGWQEGIPGMKVGGSRRLVIPPNLAYGNNPPSGIPADATLAFEIRMLGIV